MDLPKKFQSKTIPLSAFFGSKTHGDLPVNITFASSNWLIESPTFETTDGFIRTSFSAEELFSTPEKKFKFNSVMVRLMLLNDGIDDSLFVDSNDYVANLFIEFKHNVTMQIPSFNDNLDWMLVFHDNRGFFKLSFDI